MYRFLHQYQTHLPLHAQKQKLHQVQNLEACCVDLVRLPCHGPNCVEHSSPDDEGK